MEMSTNALRLTFCVTNDDLPTVTIFNAFYSLCHKFSLPQVPSQYFFSIRRIGIVTVIPVLVMKACGREEVELHTFSSSALDGLISFIPCLLEQETGCASETVWTLRRRNIAFLYKKLRDDSRSAGPVAQT